MIEQSLIFKFKVRINQAEYEALLAGLKLARDMGAERVECRTDSQLVEGHMKGTFQNKDDQLLQYVHKVKQLEACFKSVEIRYIPRKENSREDMLSKLATGKEKGHLSSIIRRVLEKPIVECFAVTSSGAKTGWKGEIIRLIKEQDDGGSLHVEDAKKIARYCLVGDDLYIRGYTTPLLKCLEGEEGEYVMRELHEGICGRHTGDRALTARISERDIFGQRWSRFVWLFPKNVWLAKSMGMFSMLRLLNYIALFPLDRLFNGEWISLDLSRSGELRKNSCW